MLCNEIHLDPAVGKGATLTTILHTTTVERSTWSVLPRSWRLKQDRTQSRASENPKKYLPTVEWHNCRVIIKYTVTKGQKLSR
jgi:hypothetical protein